MKIISLILKVFQLNIAYAHCDIPCGIYDPYNAQMAAHTVIRMTNMLNELKPSKKEPDFEERKRIISQIARLTRVKEEHGELIEEELGTLENDYFKGEHYKKFPNLKGLIQEAVKLSIKTRQTIDNQASDKMLKTVMQIAEIFYKTKDFTPVRISSGYPTGEEIVSHK